MRKFVPYVFAAAVAFVAVSPAVAAENPQKPGKWKVSMQMDIPGLPIKMPPVNMEVCLTEEDLKDPQKSVPNDPKSKCTIGDYKLDGNTATWTIDCPKQDMKGNGEVTYTEDSYSGFTIVKTGDQEIKTKYSAKWLGTCTK